MVFVLFVFVVGWGGDWVNSPNAQTVGYRWGLRGKGGEGGEEEEKEVPEKAINHNPKGGESDTTQVPYAPKMDT